MRVILVPHPRGERGPERSSNRVEWPAGNQEHKRKFLRARGDWLDGHSKGNGDLHFWGEYEGPTTIVARHTAATANQPRFTQVIDPRPGSSSGRLNTDPWLFTSGFVWSICRQISLHHPLAAGDVAIFGSVVGQHWVLDTVFVINERLEPSRFGHFGAEYSHMVEDTLAGAALRPFVGRPFAALNVPFSFVPASLSGPFARPPVDHLLANLRRSNGQPPSIANSQALTYTSPIDEHVFWQDLVRTVTEHKLVLGVRFELKLALPEPAASRVNATGSGPGCAKPPSVAAGVLERGSEPDSHAIQAPTRIEIRPRGS